MDSVNAYIYVTERCNLNCRYCYFRDKRDRVLSLCATRKFLEFLTRQPKLKNVYISGGEPLSRPDMVKFIIKYLRLRNIAPNIIVQTNGLFLNDSMIVFLKENRVILEIGIDGVCHDTCLGRKGVTKQSFEVLLKTIKKCRDENVCVVCTMVVYPKTVSRMVDNFKFLVESGIIGIDITPAAFMMWKSRDIKIFKEQYRKIFGVSGLRRFIYKGHSDAFSLNLFDISVHPGGYLLCGDVYLCLSEKMRKKYSLWNSSFVFKQDKFIFFQKQYARYSSKCMSYLEYVCSGFKIVNIIMGKNFINKGVVSLLHFMDKLSLR